MSPAQSILPKSGQPTRVITMGEGAGQWEADTGLGVQVGVKGRDLRAGGGGCVAGSRG